MSENDEPNIVPFSDLQPRKRAVLVEADGIELMPGGPGYFVGWERCDRMDKIVEWVLHLSSKPWVTTDMIHDFIEAACDHHKLNPHVGA